MLREALVVACALAVAAGPGCGSIVGLAADREVRVVTNPAGAALFVDGAPVNATGPAVVLLDPAEEHRVEARLDGMQAGTQVTRSTRTGVVIANVFLTLGLGLWIDWLTGALYTFPDKVVLNLGRAPGAEEPPLSAQFPPAPRLMPHDDPLAPKAPPPKGTVEVRSDLRQADARTCEICRAVVVHGRPCQECGQPPRDALAPR
ncbi:MAG: hypothetical protein M9894_30020 [Planctomycetes bacterium]|nr:hypothetical protein [Planctomycetota bacterium]